MSPSIGIIVLNWNRARLLDAALASLVENTPDFDACIVIDNASQDESLQVIGHWCDRDPRIRAMLQPENRGAEWINDAMREIGSDLVLILANDKRLLPGWLEYARSVFQTFPELGQLALHAPAPLDDEVWVTKPAHYVYRDGVALYRSAANTGMSSVLRRAIFASGQILFHNLNDSGPVRLPADGRLSIEIRAQGYWIAWSDRYYCLNIGHTIDEFERDQAYYAANYKAKPDLGLDGLARRIDEHRNVPKPRRTSRVFESSGDPECLPRPGLPHPERLWSIRDGGGPELEAMEMLYGLVRLIKPKSVALIRAWTGELASALALAAADNGLGRIRCIERDDSMRRLAGDCLTRHQVQSLVDFTEDASAMAPDLLVVAGYFEPGDASWIGDALDAASGCARHIAIQMAPHGVWIEPHLSRLLDCGQWNHLEIPSPRGLTLLARLG